MHPVAASTTSQLHERLKAATRRALQNAQQMELVQHLLGGTIQTADYLPLLRALHVFFARQEPILEKAITRYAVGCDFDLPTRTEWLERDLRAMGMEPHGLEGYDPTPVQSAPALIGRLYVLESVAITAHALIPSISHGLNLDSAAGGRFLQGLGHRTENHWRSFWALANALVEPTEAGIACEAAGLAADDLIGLVTLMTHTFRRAPARTPVSIASFHRPAAMA